MRKMQGQEAYGLAYSEWCDKRHEQKRRKVILLLLLLALLVGIVLFAGQLLCPRVETGIRLVPQFSNNIQEEQALLADQVEKSRITVSLIPHPVWDDESQELGINFVVVPDNNGFSERFVIQQKGRIVYESARILPGHALPTVKIPKLDSGPATATVFAVDKQGHDYGNPVSVELTIHASSGA